MRQAKILSFGSLNIDHVYRVEHLVRPGETIHSQSYDLFAGGKGMNQSVALARAGTPPYHAGQIGQDGGWLRDLLSDNTVHIDHLRVSEQPSGQAIIQVDDEGENSIILFGGADRTIRKEMIDQVLANFQQDDLLLLQNEISNVGYLMQEASKRGLTIVFNPAPMTPDVLEYDLDRIAYFMINETEGQDMTGESSPQAILDRMTERFPEAVTVLTLGAEGAIYAKGAERLSVPAFPVQAVDTTAAGDTFIGYFVASLIQGLSPQASMERAAKAAALCTTKPGAIQSIPWAKDVDNTD